MLRVWSGHQAYITEENYEPATYQSAIRCPDSAKWKGATKSYFDSIATMSTWNITYLHDGSETFQFSQLLELINLRLMRLKPRWVHFASDCLSCETRTESRYLDFTAAS